MPQPEALNEQVKLSDCLPLKLKKLFPLPVIPDGDQEFSQTNPELGPVQNEPTSQLMYRRDEYLIQKTIGLGDRIKNFCTAFRQEQRLIEKIHEKPRFRKKYEQQAN